MNSTQLAAETSTKYLLVYLDGKFVERAKASVSVFDHGFLYGDGIFEGIREYGGTVFKLREHIDRLYESANYIRLKMPLSKEDMVAAVIDTLRSNELSDAYIRLIVTRGIGGLGLNPENCATPSVMIIAEPKENMGQSIRKGIGISAMISSIRRDPVDATSHEVKSLNYLNSILARWEAIDSHKDEAIMLDTSGFVSEATAENVFIVKKKKVATPSTNSAILHGVTREKVIQIAENLGFSVSERRITPFELINSEEVFLTGTLAEIEPVLSINGRVIGSGRVGPVTLRIYGEFAKIRSRPSEGVEVYPERKKTLS